MLSIIALAAAHCAELKAQSSPKLEITSARTEADACRATGVAHPLPGSRVGFELRTLDVAPDFRRFRAKGGKIVSYFGWADSLIAPRLALDFFHRAQPARDYYRLFMVPGMGHCQGGVGPINFGQSADAAARSPNPRYDIRAALVAWVEQGHRPTA